MFNAPVQYQVIPDLQQIWEINEKQETQLDNAIDTLNNGLLPSTMEIDTVERWEKLLGITPKENDTLDDRRTRIQAQLNNKTLYTYRRVIKRLDELCKGYYHIEVVGNVVNIILGLEAEQMRETVIQVIDDMLPLNMIINTELLYNTHSVLAQYPHWVLHFFTDEELHSMPFYREISNLIEDIQFYSVEELSKYTVEQIQSFGLRKRGHIAEDYSNKVVEIKKYTIAETKQYTIQFIKDNGLRKRG